jgi:hypothetical protein
MTFEEPEIHINLLVDKCKLNFTLVDKLSMKFQKLSHVLRVEYFENSEKFNWKSEVQHGGSKTRSIHNSAC